MRRGDGSGGYEDAWLTKGDRRNKIPLKTFFVQGSRLRASSRLLDNRYLVLEALPPVARDVQVHRPRFNLSFVLSRAFLWTK